MSQPPEVVHYASPAESDRRLQFARLVRTKTMSALLDFTYRFKTKLKRYLTGKRVGDDFDWEFYTDHYRAELERGSREHTLILKPGDYQFEGGRLLKKTACLPLHPNHRLLYEMLLQLQPATLMEIGCSGGDHLHNLGLLERPFS